MFKMTKGQLNILFVCLTMMLMLIIKRNHNMLCTNLFLIHYLTLCLYAMPLTHEMANVSMFGIVRQPKKQQTFENAFFEKNVDLKMSYFTMQSGDAN